MKGRKTTKAIFKEANKHLVRLFWMKNRVKEKKMVKIHKIGNKIYVDLQNLISPNEANKMQLSNTNRFIVVD